MSSHRNKAGHCAGFLLVADIFFSMRATLPHVVLPSPPNIIMHGAKQAC
jgi:predicted molibdopterin-dependent oxidoreductase YjgC